VHAVPNANADSIWLSRTDPVLYYLAYYAVALFDKNGALITQVSLPPVSLGYIDRGGDLHSNSNAVLGVVGAHGIPGAGGFSAPTLRVTKLNPDGSFHFEVLND
jgi:hypothetical protein